MVAEQPGAALQLLQSPPAPPHRSRKERRRKGESSFRLSLSLSTSCSVGELRCRATCQGRGAPDRLGLEESARQRQRLGDGRRQSPPDNAILAAVAAFARACRQQPASGSSFDGSSSMATLNGVGSLPRSAVRSLCFVSSLPAPLVRGLGVDSSLSTLSLSCLFWNMTLTLFGL